MSQPLYPRRPQRRTKKRSRRLALLILLLIAIIAAVAAGDRGTQRICVWGEKVTRMLESLLNRYQKDGEAFLKDTQVWVCTVCGFIYVGDSAPQLCPVCKVPAWKFEKIEGRG